MKYVRVILTPEAEDAYHYLTGKASDSKQEETTLNSFLQKVELIKENVHYGQPIAKKPIPAEYKNRYGITNLFRWNSLISGGCFTRLLQEVQVSKSSFWCLT